MNIKFLIIEIEVDTSYNFTNTLLDPIEVKLNSLHKDLKHYSKLFKSDDYKLCIYLTPTRKNDKLVVKGPGTYSKSKTVEFYFWIPYLEGTYTEQMFDALDYMAEGFQFVFNKYKTDPSGVKEAFDSVKNLIATDPEKYQHWTKK